MFRILDATYYPEHESIVIAWERDQYSIIDRDSDAPKDPPYKLFLELEKCRTCGGTGVCVIAICPTCMGTGYIEARETT